MTRRQPGDILSAAAKVFTWRFFNVPMPTQTLGISKILEDAVFLRLMHWAAWLPARIFIPKISAPPSYRWTVWDAMTGNRRTLTGNGPSGRKTMHRLLISIHPSGRWPVCAYHCYLLGYASSDTTKMTQICKAYGRIFSNAHACYC